jgi:CHAT domain-containing protein
MVMHAACHGTASPISPLDSALVLSGDDRLSVREVLERRLEEMSLAVLSACETGMIGEALPDETIGLPVALLQAGTRTVLASQWAVPNLSTAVLVAAFYERWRRNSPPSEALRDAQTWLRDATNGELEQRHPGIIVPPAPEGPTRNLWRRARPYEHPYYWAAFMITGDGMRPRR